MQVQVFARSEYDPIPVSAIRVDPATKDTEIIGGGLVIDTINDNRVSWMSDQELTTLRLRGLLAPVTQTGDVPVAS